MLNNCLFIIPIFLNNFSYFAILIDFSNSGMFFWKRLSQLTVVKAITVCSDMLKIGEYFLHFPLGVLVQVCKAFKNLKKKQDLPGNFELISSPSCIIWLLSSL